MSLSNYPAALDTDANLYLVHDSLRVKLAEDYTVGDTTITIYDENNVIGMFPPTGIIRLTEQCSDIDLRALSFTYTGVTSTTFTGLVLLDGFTDNDKPKNLTNVTLNVMAQHHNSIKDAVIAIENFVGIQGTIDTVPFGSTIEGRLNFLRKLIFTPRAWFTADKTIGLVPLEVTFTDRSFHYGDGSVVYIWDFGDHTSSIVSNISVASIVPPGEVNVIVQDLDGGTIRKTYSSPNKYTVKLTVRNEFGEDTVIFDDFINARIPAPDEAVISITPTSDQLMLELGQPAGGPYSITPVIRSAVNSSIDISLPAGKNPATGRSYAGEELYWDGSAWIARDPIEEYTWSFGDDLTHSNHTSTTAMYAIGGLYDLILRVDTIYGCYRITKYPNAFNIVEPQNIWIWTFPGPLHPVNQYTVLDYLTLQGDIHSNEFGLMSETFKVSATSLAVVRSDAFLTGTDNEGQAKQEFRRNVAFSPKGLTSSGNEGDCLLYYATQSALAPVTTCLYWNHVIDVTEYNGFNDTYVNQDTIVRPWNWTCLSSQTTSTSYFLFGTGCEHIADTNDSYPYKTSYDVLTFTQTTDELTLSDFENGAEELLSHPSVYDGGGNPTNGYFATYRSAWKGSTGYILRNSGVGNYFRIASFYKTLSVVGTEFYHITKLSDMAGPIKVEGELVALSDGLFFFNNTGNISAYNDTTGVWETGGASSGSASFRSLQDTGVQGFDLAENTLLATSDYDHNAYLSYDYSNSAFIKFNSLELTFSSVGPRPGWEDYTQPQFAIGMF